MTRISPAALFLVMLCGCTTKPVKTTQVHRPDLQTATYQEFVTRRTDELQRMGGPLQDRSVAQSKAEEEAKARYGEVPPDYSTTWSWGKGAGAEAAQAEVKENLEKMDRDAARR
ncbi:MAG: hypothetical protein ABIZ04_11615 [Opitutus sp.]